MSNNGTKPPPAKAETTKSPLSIAQAFLNTRLTHIEDVLPPGMKGQGERLIKRALLSMSKSDKLMACSIESFFQCVLAAAELGLAIDGKLAHAVPYSNKKKDAAGREFWVDEAQFQIDYKGMVAVARRTKVIKDAFARLVYRDDHFEQEITDAVCHFTHRPGPAREVVLGAYACVVFPDGYFQMDWMLVHELEKVRARSKAGAKGFSPWQTDLGEMYKKTVLKRLLKLFMDADSYLVAAFIADEEDDVIEGTATESIEQAVPPVGRVRHGNRLTGEMPLAANFTSEDQELEPVETPKQEQAAVKPAAAPAPISEEKELHRREVIEYLEAELATDLTGKALDAVGDVLRNNQTLLGLDLLEKFQKQYQAKRGAIDQAFASSTAAVRRPRNF